MRSMTPEGDAKKNWMIELDKFYFYTEIINNLKSRTQVYRVREHLSQEVKIKGKGG